MSKLVDRTGQTFGNFTILKELGRLEGHSKTSVLVRCNLCGKEVVRTKSKIVNGELKTCGCGPKSRYVDLTGKTVGVFTVLKELGRMNDANEYNYVLARCNLCGKESMYPKSCLKTYQSCGCKSYMSKIGETIGNWEIIDEEIKQDNAQQNRYVTIKCKKCGNIEYTRFSYVKKKVCKNCKEQELVGQTFGNFTVTKITNKKTSGGHIIIAKCNFCGKENEFVRSRITSKTNKLPYSCGCTKKQILFKDLTGQIINGFKVIKELGNSKVLIKCETCGAEKISYKSNFQRGLMCQNCVSTYDRIIKGTKKDKTGQTFGYMTITKELGNRKVMCRCNLCGKEREVEKANVTSLKLISCGCLPSYRKIPEKHLLGYTLLSWEYRGRDGSNYYQVQKDGSNEIEIKSFDSILKENGFPVYYRPAKGHPMILKED